jgi:hypothetical protein
MRAEPADLSAWHRFTVRLAESSARTGLEEGSELLEPAQSSGALDLKVGAAKVMVHGKDRQGHGATAFTCQRRWLEEFSPVPA